MPSQKRFEPNNPQQPIESHAESETRNEFQTVIKGYAQGSHHPDRFILGKVHPDRAKQFIPFAALNGYENLVDSVVDKANETHDFTDLEEPC